ncbi:MAG TPA: MbcA/ParS/Xre antitoxin family protein [Bryobacteraceae bacterium]|nr:MbcA/ParS/Xre antitoxin family protein [Bryobacteraceae bacterium]
MSAARASVLTETELFNPETGRLDAACIAKEFGLPVSTIARSIGRKAPGVRKHPDSPGLQNGLRRLYRIWATALELYGNNRTNARIFLNAPNRHLQNEAPVDFIASGELQVVESLLESMELRQPM